MAPVNGASTTENGHIVATSKRGNDLLLGNDHFGRSSPLVVSSPQNDTERRLAEVDSSLISSYRNVLLAVGEDPSRDGLRKTPERAAKAIWFFTTGYRQNLKGKFDMKTFDGRCVCVCVESQPYLV